MLEQDKAAKIKKLQGRILELEKRPVKVSSIEYILAFAKKENYGALYTSPNKSEIKPIYLGTGISRVFNDGHGSLELADFANDDVTLILNDLLLKPSEKHTITVELNKLKIPYVFVSFGYPSYYNTCLNGFYQQTLKKVI